MEGNINIGTMDRYITIRSKSTAKDSFGHADPTYTDVASVFASRTWPDVSEANAVTGANVTEKVEYTIHARAGIDTGMEVADDGATYRIVGINYLNKLFMRLKVEKA